METTNIIIFLLLIYIIIMIVAWIIKNIFFKGAKSILLFLITTNILAGIIIVPSFIKLDNLPKHELINSTTNMVNEANETVGDNINEAIDIINVDPEYTYRDNINSFVEHIKDIPKQIASAIPESVPFIGSKSKATSQNTPADAFTSYTSFPDGLHGYEQNTLPYYNGNRKMINQSLDNLGRAVDGHIQVKASQLPQESREPKLKYNPVGWHNYKFLYKSKDNTLQETWLMNRGHLIGYQFSGLNDVGDNLTPMTHYLNAGRIGKGMDASNTDAMLYYETQLRQWVEQNPKMSLDYQVTPLYKDNELLPRQIRLSYIGYNTSGQLIPIQFNTDLEKHTDDGVSVVFLENVSPQATINYATGTATTEDAK